MKIFPICIGLWCVLLTASTIAQTDSAPSTVMRLCGGLFGPQSQERHGYSCPKNKTFLPAYSLSASWRFHKNVEVGLKFGWSNSVHNYSFYKTFYDGTPGIGYCYKEYHDNLSIGPEMRFIVLAKHRFNIQPALSFQIAKQQLTKTLLSIKDGPFNPTEPPYGYVNHSFLLLGTSMTLNFDLNNSISIGLTPTYLLGVNVESFGKKYGCTVDVVVKF